MLPTTGRYSQKMYRCTRCGHESLHGTNHWGEIYPRCSKCSWKNPLQPQVTHTCLEPVPEGYGTPEPWAFARLGDLVEIVRPPNPLGPRLTNPIRGHHERPGGR